MHLPGATEPYGAKLRLTRLRPLSDEEWESLLDRSDKLLEPQKGESSMSFAYVEPSCGLPGAVFTSHH